MSQYEKVFQPKTLEDGSYAPSQNKELADRLDYLDAYCRSINRYRDD